MSSKSVKIAFPASVQEAVEEYCFSEISVEVGGFLVGTLDENGPVINAAIPSLKAVSGQTNLTIGHDAWEEIHNVIAADFPDQQIVGWFHSHPGFGVFLSEYDMFIQENFFSDSRQVALVVDPLSGTLGWFNFENGMVNEQSKASTFKERVAKADEERSDVLDRLSETKSQPNRLPIWKIAIPSVLLLTAIGAISWNAGSANGWKKAEIQYTDAIRNEQIRARNIGTQLSYFTNGLATVNFDKGGYNFTADGQISWQQLAQIFYLNPSEGEALKFVNNVAKEEMVPQASFVVWIPANLYEAKAQMEELATQSPVPTPSASDSGSSGPTASPKPSGSASGNPTPSPTASPSTVKSVTPTPSATVKK